MDEIKQNSFKNMPDENGRFGIHGGRFVAETLMPLILQVESAYKEVKTDPDFNAELLYYQKFLFLMLFEAHLSWV